MPRGVYIRTQSYKDKLSKALKGRISPRKGVVLSEETKRKLSEASKGKHYSFNTEFKKGMVNSKETCRKMSNARKGENNPNWKNGISVHYKKQFIRPKPDNCEICGTSVKEIKWLCYDHDHKTGEFRGWICVKCNNALGMVNDDPMILTAMIDYLKK